jgi:hypothetical protein
MGRMEMPETEPELFKGRPFDREVIMLCVRWYLSFKLSSRDLVQMMSERGIALAHTTILRWVQRYVPEFEKRWFLYARPVSGSWRCDETYIKVKGRWTYLYRAVDKQGRTVDFLLSEKRDVAAAKRFFRIASGRTIQSSIRIIKTFDPRTSTWRVPPIRAAIVARLLRKASADVWACVSISMASVLSRSLLASCSNLFFQPYHRPDLRSKAGCAISPLLTIRTLNSSGTSEKFIAPGLSSAA